jgi:hypothetical protein
MRSGRSGCLRPVAHRVALVIALRGVLVKPEATGDRPVWLATQSPQRVCADTDDSMHRLGYEETTIATYHAAGIV